MHKPQDPSSTAADGAPGSRAAPSVESRLQAFGALAVLDAVTLRGLRYTADAPQVLGCDVQTLLGESFGKQLVPAARKVFTAFQNSDQRTQEAALPFPIIGPAGRRRLPACLHRRDGILLVELLPGRQGLAVRRPALTGESMARVLASSHRALAQASSLAELCERTAALVQTRLGFAHAAVLRYEPSGAALTQAAVYGVGKGPREELLHHPAPALPLAMTAGGPAHQLVMLADTESPSIELAPAASAQATPLELAGCLLHAPSPACVDHVRALGGRAMLAVRLEQPDPQAPPSPGVPPWGLLLCWDPRPQVPSAATRALAQSLAHLFSIQLGVLDARRIARRRSESDHRRTESQKLDSLGVLAAGIAHDFNNLLTGILGNASLLRADVRRGRHTDSYLAQIEETSLRAAELCKQMLAYAGKGQFTVRAVQLNALIAETLPLTDLAPAVRQAVQLELGGALPAVRGDVEQLRQVLSNLLRNAAEALPRQPGSRPPVSTRSPSRLTRSPVSEPAAAAPSAPITITTTLRTLDAEALRSTHGNPDAQPGEYVALAVRDTGCGIPAPVQARMFEPFFSTKPDARGLGLSTVIGIVRGHGGVLLVQSESGRGSTFTVFLPVARAPRGDSSGPSLVGF